MDYDHVVQITQEKVPLFRRNNRPHHDVSSPGWYFWTPDYRLRGPYDTRPEARAAEQHYWVTQETDPAGHRQGRVDDR